MKKITQKFLLFIAGALVSLGGYSQTIYNFDLNYNTDDQYPTEGNWNNHYSSDWEAVISNFIDDQGNASTYSFAVTDNFVAGNGSGITNPDSNLGFPATATNDSYYVQDGDNNTGAFTFSGLNPSNFYTFEIFASREGATENRETQYDLVGANSGVGYLNPSSNTSETAIIENIQPDGAGNIVLTVQKGPNNENGAGYAYIGAIKITETTSMAVENKSFMNTISIYPNPVEDQFELSLNLTEASLLKVQLYNLKGQLISTFMNEQVPAGKINKTLNSQNQNASLASGIYILKISTDRSTQTKKLIIK